MHRIAIVAGALALAFAAAPAEAGVRKNGLEPNGFRWNGINRNGLEPNGFRFNGTAAGGAIPTPRLEGVVLRDGTVLRPANR